MAESQQPAHKNVQSPNPQKTSALVKVELLAAAWDKPRDDGKGHVRYTRGAILEVPQAIFDKFSSESNFKPAFRKVPKDADS